MTGEYTYPIKYDRLRAVSELLATHYGLGITYLARQGKREDDYVDLEFPCSYEDFISCFKSERKFINKNGNHILKRCDLPNTPENALVIDAIWLIMSVCCIEDWGCEMPDDFTDYMNSFVSREWDEDEIQDFLAENYDQWLDEFYDVKARKDLLELYLYHQQTLKQIREQIDSPTQLTIKYGKGKSVKLENKDNWFERVLLYNHLRKYLPDIKSEEDAINALNVLTHRGRKLARPLMYHFIYGTYSMVSEHLGKETATESFCQLLIDLMEQMDYPLTYAYKGGSKEGEIAEIDTMYIRKMISKLKQDAPKYRFNLDVWIKATEEDLKRSGRFLYRRMGW